MLCNYVLKKENGENMFAIIDLASIGAIVALFTVVVYNIRKELKIK